MTINLSDEEIRVLASACKEHVAIIRICKELEIGSYTKQSIDRLEDIAEKLLEVLTIDNSR